MESMVEGGVCFDSIRLWSPIFLLENGEMHQWEDYIECWLTVIMGSEAQSPVLAHRV